MDQKNNTILPAYHRKQAKTNPFYLEESLKSKIETFNVIQQIESEIKHWSYQLLQTIHLIHLDKDYDFDDIEGMINRQTGIEIDIRSSKGESNLDFRSIYDRIEEEYLEQNPKPRMLDEAQREAKIEAIKEDLFRNNVKPLENELRVFEDHLRMLNNGNKEDQNDVNGQDDLETSRKSSRISYQHSLLVLELLIGENILPTSWSSSFYRPILALIVGQKESSFLYQKTKGYKSYLDLIEKSNLTPHQKNSYRPKLLNLLTEFDKMSKLDDDPKLKNIVKRLNNILLKLDR